MTDEEFVSAVAQELKRARAKFPGAAATFPALIEEVGEVGKALMYEPWGNVVIEAIQVATMAQRLAIEGDETMRNFRLEAVRDYRILRPADIMPAALSDQHGAKAEASANPGEKR